MDGVQGQERDSAAMLLQELDHEAAITRRVLERDFKTAVADRAGGR